MVNATTKTSKRQYHARMNCVNVICAAQECSLSGKTQLRVFVRCLEWVFVCRLQLPVQNPKSDNTNVLWNSQSLGKNNSYRLPLML